MPFDDARRRNKTTRSVAPCLLVALTASCSASSPTAPAATAPSARTCPVTLPPRAAPLKPAPVAAQNAAKPSRLVVHADVSLARIAAELETRIDRRLAQVRGADAGPAGRANYTIDRGPLSVAIEDHALVVSATVQAHAEICARGHCYAHCRPAAIARASVPLQLTDAYRFQSPKLTATFTRGCKIKTLGGFLTVDVTPTLKRQLEPQLRQVERDIARQLPDLRPEAQRLWTELSKNRAVPLLGCVAPGAQGIVQGPVESRGDSLRLRFALRATPELRSECDPASPAPELPALEQDPHFDDNAELSFGQVSPLTALATAFESMPPVTLERAQFTVTHATLTAGAHTIQADLTLAGDVCGRVALSALPTWSRDGRSVELTGAILSPGEAERVAAASLRAGPLARALAGAPRLPLPLDITRIQQTVPRIVASATQHEAIAIDVDIERVRPVSASMQSGDIVATAGMQARVNLRER